MLRIENINKEFNTKQNSVKALTDINIRFLKKGLIFINGESGSGKTTLLNILAGLDSPTSGKVFFNDGEISSYKEKEWSYYRNINTGIVFQDFNLIEDINVKENLILPLEIQSYNQEEKLTIVNNILKYVGLEGYEDRKISQLSAGQKQRIAIARAIIKCPDILLADEATGNLDPETSIEIMELFEKISKKCLVILISHNDELAKKYADRIITLKKGKIINDIDNKIIKGLSRYPYKITINNRNKNVTRTENITLEQFDIKEEIKRNESYRLLEKERLILEIGIEKHKNDKKNRSEIEWEKKEKVKGLSNKSLLLDAVKNLMKNKGRTAMTIFLVATISMLFLVCTNIIGNDYDKTISDYVSKNSDRGFFVYKNCETQELKDKMSVNLVKGSNFIENLYEIIDDKNIIKSFESCDIEYGKDYNLSESINILEYKKCEFFNKILQEGKLPENENEVVLDENIVSTNGIAIGDNVILAGTKCTVVGISTYSTKERGSYSVVSSNVMKQAINNSEAICLQGTNITRSMDVDNYAYSSVVVAPVKTLDHKEVKILHGNYPKNKNEFIISKALADELEITDWDKAITKYRLPNLHDKKYNYIYDNIPNLFEYMGKNVTLVGIYELEDETYDLILDDDVYSELVKNYLRELNYDECMLYLGKNNYDDIKSLSENNYVIDDEICSYIYLYKNITKKIEDFSLGIEFLLLLVILIILISFFSYRVKDSAKKIGIFRAIGISVNDIFKMFLFENVIVIIMSIVVAIIEFMCIMILINSKIQEIINNNHINMFIKDYKSSALSSIMILSFVIIVTIVPFKKLIKRQSINLINNV